MLEFTSHTTDQIAWSIGYAYPRSFRKLLHKIMGWAPGDRLTTESRQSGIGDLRPRVDVGAPSAKFL
jgi:transcriptional regulator GlxA family with amidase domain